MTNSKAKKRHVNGKELSQALKTNDVFFVDFLNRCLEWVWRIIFVSKVREFSNTSTQQDSWHIVCASQSVSWQSMQNPIGERLLKIPQLTQHKSSTRDVQGKVNKWYRGSLSRSWRIRNWPQSSAAVQLHYASSAAVQAIFISNSDYKRLRTSVVKEHIISIMHAWSAFVLSLLIE